ncbi:MAG TPA: vitamin K epoxide reductase family protein [Thermoanaerobaculia bacterium]|nr:vitamin K epoxide reductase family protein [Thermoanaerobaculia bacterium]
MLIAALAAAAMCVAVYLGLYQLRVIATVWDPLFGRGSELVLDSRVSQAIRRFTIVPDSILGAVAYGCELIFALIGSTERYRRHRWLVLLFGVNSAALAVAALALVALQAFVIHAGCFFCLASAGCSLTIAGLAIEEVRAAA